MQNRIIYTPRTNPNNGKIMGAEMLITGELFETNECYELYVKLLNVETAEVLSVTKTRIDKSLGL